MNDQLIDQFVETWGALGSQWGISNSVARVHGLLIISDKSWCLDEIVDRLQISKGNASTCLKELRTWNVIRKVFQPGDRREFYTCDPDAWEMLFNIMRQRKQREFDPIVSNVSNSLIAAEEDSTGIALKRLQQMNGMLDTFNKLGNTLLANQSRAKYLLKILGKG